MLFHGPPNPLHEVRRSSGMATCEIGGIGANVCVEERRGISRRWRYT